jgi:hypothetical protein
MKKIVALTLMTSLVAGCASTNQGMPSNNAGQQQAAAGSKDPCTVGATALAGVAVGALLGGLIDGKKGAKRGAVAGGVIAAIGCVAINSQSRQTKSAAQADSEYIQQRGRLAPEPQVVSYTPRLESNVVQRGQPMHVYSVVELVNGSVSPVQEVREELVVYGTDGQPFKTGSKPLINNRGGRFENSFELTLPNGVSQGIYAMKTNLYVNGKLSASRDLRTQLVWNGTTGVMVAGL